MKVINLTGDIARIDVEVDRTLRTRQTKFKRHPPSVESLGRPWKYKRAKCPYTFVIVTFFLHASRVFFLMEKEGLFHILQFYFYSSISLF